MKGYGRIAGSVCCNIDTLWIGGEVKILDVGIPPDIIVNHAYRKIQLEDPMNGSSNGGVDVDQ